MRVHGNLPASGKTQACLEQMIKIGQRRHIIVSVRMSPETFEEMKRKASFTKSETGEPLLFEVPVDLVAGWDFGRVEAVTK